MAQRFCDHLQDYGALYERVETCEARCNELFAGILANGSNPAAVGELIGAVEAWRQVDRELRAALVELVSEGRILIPKKKPRAVMRHGAPCCSECGLRIPKLRLQGWEIAANGAVAFQGRELAAGTAPLGAGA